MLGDIDRARDALNAIPPDLPRDEWVRAAMAANAAGVTFDEFDAWSSRADTYDSRAARDVWRSIKPGGGIGPGTLYRMAVENGWTPSDRVPRERPSRAPRSPQAGPVRMRPGMSAAAVWARCEPAAASHPYIEAKQGIPDGLRMVPKGDALRIAGASVAGWLVVPVLPLAGGEPVSLQFIPPPGEGKKLNLPGAPVAGVFTVGDMVPGGTVVLAEGIGQAWTAWKATGAAAVVCFGWGRVRGVAAELRQRDASARLVLAPDRGKEGDAEAVAREVGALFVTMPEDWPQNADINDFARREGFDALEALLSAPKAPEPPPMPFALVPVADLDGTEPPAPAFVWEGLIPAETVTLLAAHGGSGKSFVALMLCVATCLGLPLFGLGTRQGKACFFSGEDGAALLRYRLRYLCRRMGVRVEALDGRLFIIDATEHDPRLYVERSGRRDGDLTPTFDSLREFVQREGIGLLVLDNASDTFDASEIDRARVRAFMRALTVLARQTGAGVLLLAHVDKGTSRGDRGPNSEGYSGSTAWHNSARSRLFMRRDAEGAIVLEHQKGTHSAGLLAPLRLLWARDSIPVLDAPLSPMMQGITERAATKALLRLIHEFTARGEWVASATTSRNHAGKLLRQEATFPKVKDSELFDLLRQAERAGQLERVTYRGADRKERERWQVTSDGMRFASIAATAAGAATTDVTAPGAGAASPAATAATSPPGGVGEKSAHRTEGWLAHGG